MNCPKTKSDVLGFTLVEIMIVVAIIGLLAAIAVPAFSKSRREAKVSQFLNDVRVAVDYVEMYAMETGDYPPDRFPGQAPDGATDFLNSFDWAAATPLGGQWDWEHDAVGIGAGLSALDVTASVDDLQRVDERVDNGDLNSGVFRRTSATRYTYVIEE